MTSVLFYLSLAVTIGIAVCMGYLFTALPKRGLWIDALLLLVCFLTPFIFLSLCLSGISWMSDQKGALVMQLN